MLTLGDILFPLARDSCSLESILQVCALVLNTNM